MKLRSIYLILDDESYPGSFRSDFDFQTRCLCNFIQRRVRAARIPTQGFNAIVVCGVETPRDSCPIVSVKSTVPEVHFDRQRYESLKGADLHEFFIGMLEEGLKKCAMHHEIPTELLFSSIREFREGGYKNEWVHHKKLFRPHGIRTELRCCLTMSEFRLTFAATKKGDVIYEKCIFETKPDEICFAHKFKEVKLLDDNFVVVAAFADPLFSLPLADLLDT